MPPPIAASKAIDATPLVVAVRMALLADATITGSVPTIRTDDAEPQDSGAYIIVTLVSAVPDRDTSYEAPGVEAVIQATLVTTGTATALRTALVPHMLSAVLDANLVAAGYTIWDVTLAQQRNYSDVQIEVVRRYGAVQFNVRATKP